MDLVTFDDNTAIEKFIGCPVFFLRPSSYLNSPGNGGFPKWSKPLAEKIENFVIFGPLRHQL